MFIFGHLGPGNTFFCGKCAPFSCTRVTFTTKMNVLELLGLITLNFIGVLGTSRNMCITLGKISVFQTLHNIAVNVLSFRADSCNLPGKRVLFGLCELEMLAGKHFDVPSAHPC